MKVYRYVSSEATLTTTTQAPDTVSAPAAPSTGRKLLKGGAEITHAILKKNDEKSVRWFRGQVANLAGVVWQLVEGGELFAWEDELMAHFEMKAAEAKATALAAAEAKAAEKEELRKAAVKSATPEPASARPRKMPAPKAIAARKPPAPRAAPQRRSRVPETVL
jgi:hypothetical protein